MYMLYFIQVNPLYYSSLPFPSYSPLFNSFHCVLLCWVNGEGDWLMQFMNLYENRTMRPVEVVLSRGKEIRENDVGGK
jgi:hypothetical protein